MQIRIQEQGVALTPELVGHVEERVHFALARFNGDIRSVLVKLIAQTAPQCIIEVRTTWRKPIRIQETDANIHAAVTRAMERAGRAADRHTAASAKGLNLLPQLDSRPAQRSSSAASRRH